MSRELYDYIIEMREYIVKLEQRIAKLEDKVNPPHYRNLGNGRMGMDSFIRAKKDKMDSMTFMV